MRKIPAIDKDIEANQRELRGRRPIRIKVSTADWQDAWNQEPELLARDRSLHLERGLAQLEAAKREYEAAMQQRSRVNKPKKCPTCGRPDWHAAA